jgi:regulator of protease activity HflC (stomatin/prohibitin superfamily)
MAQFLAPLICLAVASFNALRYFVLVGYPSSYLLLPYQDGILFKRGRPARTIGAGRHRVFVGTEKVLFLDKRPIQVNAEDRAVTLADGATVVYSFSASAQVNDVMKATYAAANYTRVPAFVSLAAARATLNNCRTSRIPTGKAGMEEDIAASCRTRLATAGFELLSFRLTRLVIVAPPPQITSRAN